MGFFQAEGSTPWFGACILLGSTGNVADPQGAHELEAWKSAQIVGVPFPELREWHTNNLGRLPGLKFMRTLWVCDIAGGPQQYAGTKPGSTPLGLEEAHRELKISPAEFDEVAAELARTLDSFNVPEREKEEVLG